MKSPESTLLLFMETTSEKVIPKHTTARFSWPPVTRQFCAAQFERISKPLTGYTKHIRD